MAVSVVATFVSGGVPFFQEGNSDTVVKTGGGNDLVVLQGNAQSAAAGRTITSADFGTQAWTVDQVGPAVTLISFQMYRLSLSIKDTLIPTVSSTQSIVWNGSMNNDGSGIGIHLSGVDQTTPYFDQSATSGIQEESFANSVPTDLTFTCLTGDIVLYTLTNNNLDAGTITNFTRVNRGALGGGSTGSTQLDEGATYRYIPLTDQTNVTIPAPVGSSSGYHSVQVYSAAETAITATGDLASGDSEMAGVANVIIDASGNLQSGDSDLDGVAQFSQDVITSGNLQTSDSEINGSVNIIIIVSGNLQATDSEMDGVAASGELVTTSGNLQSGDSQLDGSANALLDIVGELQASNSEMNGVVNVIVNTSGNLVSSDSQLDGIANQGVVSIASGDLASGDSDLDGVANVVVAASGNLVAGNSEMVGISVVAIVISGDLASGNSEINGAANIVVTTSGDLQTTDSQMNGFAFSGGLVIASGNLVSSNSFMDGLANFIINIIPTPAPTDRTFNIELENRTFTIEKEDRTFIVRAGDEKMKTIPKDPQARLNYSFDLNDWIETDDSYSAHQITVSSGLTLVADSEIDNIITAVVSGGASQGIESILCNFTTTNGYTDERTILLDMGNR